MARSSLRNVPFALLLSFVALFLFTASVSGQITDVTNVTSTPIPGAGHDYIKLFSETVNPSNGSVSLRIQVPTPPGRRLSLPFAFAYDTNGAHHMESNGKGVLLWWDNTAALATGGWSYSLPTLSNVMVDIPGTIGADCVYYNNYVFQDETGGRHSLDLALNASQPGTCPNIVSKLRGGDDYYQAVIPQGVFVNTNAPLLITDADGTVYTFPCCNLPYLGSGGQLNSQPQSGLPSSIEDRNGNVIQIGSGGTVTDTLGRTMLSIGSTIMVSGLGGPYTPTWGKASSNYAVGSAVAFNDGSCATTIHNDIQSLNVISQLELPDNTFYKFYYDPTYPF